MKLFANDTSAIKQLCCECKWREEGRFSRDVWTMEWSISRKQLDFFSLNIHTLINKTNSTQCVNSNSLQDSSTCAVLNLSFYAWYFFFYFSIIALYFQHYNNSSNKTPLISGSSVHSQKNILQTYLPTHFSLEASRRVWISVSLNKARLFINCEFNSF
jgi:hypothetical protein